MSKFFFVSLFCMYSLILGEIMNDYLPKLTPTDFRFMAVFFAFMALDQAGGIYNAWRKKVLTWNAWKVKTGKKMIHYGTVFTFAGAAAYLRIGGDVANFKNLLLMYAITHEGLSCLKQAKRAGVNISAIQKMFVENFQRPKP